MKELATVDVLEAPPLVSPAGSWVEAVESSIPCSSGFALVSDFGHDPDALAAAIDRALTFAWCEGWRDRRLCEKPRLVGWSPA